MLSVVTVIGMLMPAITKLVEAILSPVYDAEAERAAVFALQNAITEARFTQFTKDNPRP